MSKKKVVINLQEDGAVQILNSNLFEYVSGGGKKKPTPPPTGTNIICAPNASGCIQNAYCDRTDDTKGDTN